MNQINWKKKLTSRKFWAALMAVVLSLLTIFRVSDTVQAQVEALGWGIAALIAYIVGEGLVDAKSAGKKDQP